MYSLVWILVVSALGRRVCNHLAAKENFGPTNSDPILQFNHMIATQCLICGSLFGDRQYQNPFIVTDLAVDQYPFCGGPLRCRKCLVRACLTHKKKLVAKVLAANQEILSQAHVAE